MTNLTTPTQITAQELRIGNWIISPMGSSLQVYSIFPEGIGVPNVKELFSYEQIKPIPLTPEILENAGFEKKSNDTGPPINDTVESFDKDGYSFSIDTSGFWYLNGYNWNTKRFKYIHQLQNLYYALTGEELVFDLIDNSMVP